jgi:hypothetical protein
MRHSHGYRLFPVQDAKLAYDVAEVKVGSAFSYAQLETNIVARHAARSECKTLAFASRKWPALLNGRHPL